MFNACKVASLGNIYELIRNGADVNHTSNKKSNHKTPIFKARTDEVVSILLKHGADPYAKLDGKGNEKTTRASNSEIEFRNSVIEFQYRFRNSELVNSVIF